MLSQTVQTNSARLNRPRDGSLILKIDTGVDADGDRVAQAVDIGLHTQLAVAVVPDGKQDACFYHLVIVDRARGERA